MYAFFIYTKNTLLVSFYFQGSKQRQSVYVRFQDAKGKKEDGVQKYTLVHVLSVPHTAINDPRAQLMQAASGGSLCLMNHTPES